MTECEAEKLLRNLEERARIAAETTPISTAMSVVANFYAALLYALWAKEHLDVKDDKAFTHKLNMLKVIAEESGLSVPGIGAMKGGRA